MPTYAGQSSASLTTLSDVTGCEGLMIIPSSDSSPLEPLTKESHERDCFNKELSSAKCSSASFLNDAALRRTLRDSKLSKVERNRIITFIITLARAFFNSESLDKSKKECSVSLSDLRKQ